MSQVTKFILATDDPSPAMTGCTPPVGPTSMLLFPVIPFSIALAASLVAAFTDAGKFRISNLLTGPLLISGLIYHSLSVEGIGLVPSVLGVSIGFMPMAVLYLSGGVGAGDVKLMAALGAWLGPLVIVQVFLASWIAAGVYACGVMLCNAVAPGRERIRYHVPVLTPQGSGERLAQLIVQRDRRRLLIPFGVMILSGVVVAATLVTTDNVPHTLRIKPHEVAHETF